MTKILKFGKKWTFVQFGPKKKAAAKICEVTAHFCYDTGRTTTTTTTTTTATTATTTTSTTTTAAAAAIKKT